MMEKLKPNPESSESENGDFTDPGKYIEVFNESNEYKNAFQLRLKELKADNFDSMSEERKSAVLDHFVGCELWKNALWLFWNKHKLRYKKEQLPSKFNTALGEYWKQIKETEKVEAEGDTDQYKIKQFDNVRIKLHREAAEKLMEDGIVNNLTLGRFIVHFLSIDQGVDVPDPDRDEKRLAAYRNEVMSETREAAG